MLHIKNLLVSNSIQQNKFTIVIGCLLLANHHYFLKKTDSYAPQFLNPKKCKMKPYLKFFFKKKLLKCQKTSQTSLPNIPPLCAKILSSVKTPTKEGHLRNARSPSTSLSIFFNFFLLFQKPSNKYPPSHFPIMTNEGPEIPV